MPHGVLWAMAKLSNVMQYQRKATIELWLEPFGTWTNHSSKFLVTGFLPHGPKQLPSHVAMEFQSSKVCIFLYSHPTPMLSVYFVKKWWDDAMLFRVQSSLTREKHTHTRSDFIRAFSLASPRLESHALQWTWHTSMRLPQNRSRLQIVRHTEQTACEGHQQHVVVSRILAPKSLTSRSIGSSHFYSQL